MAQCLSTTQPAFIYIERELTKVHFNRFATLYVNCMGTNAEVEGNRCSARVGAGGRYCKTSAQPLLYEFKISYFPPANYKTLDFGPKCQENAFWGILFFIFFWGMAASSMLRAFGVRMLGVRPPFQNSGIRDTETPIERLQGFQTRKCLLLITTESA